MKPTIEILSTLTDDQYTTFRMMRTLCYRFSIETGAIDGHGYSSEYKAILDPAKYYDAIDRSIVNDATRQIGALRNCSMDQIREIARILGIENKFCERKYKAEENA